MVDSAPAKTLEVPGYRLCGELGEGGMARVYLAVQESLEREVAIKVLSADLVSDPEFCRRFLKEGKTLAKITHPHVVTIYDSGEYQGNFYMCMELIRGGTLEDLIAQGKLSLKRSITVLKQVAGALEWSHGKGLVHRDIKPGNVLFRDENTAVLSDFGIAKSVSKNATRLTEAGLAIGTPTYMSPEQASAKPLTPASDQYSLAVMFYEMLTGEVPYKGDTGLAIVLQHLQEPVPTLPDEYSALQPIIARMMAKRPEDRFATLAEVVAALERQGSDAASARRTEVLSDRKWVPSEKRWVIPTIGGGLLVVLIAAAYVLTRQDSVPESPPIRTPSVINTPKPSNPLDAATRKKVEEWLGIAQTHYEIGRLEEPPGSNAMEAFQRVLELDPNNPKALEGLRHIGTTFEKLARESLNDGNLKVAKNLVNKGLRAFPEHKGLVQLRDQLANE